jgi:hypothetical protein
MLLVSTGKGDLVLLQQAQDNSSEWALPGNNLGPCVTHKPSIDHMLATARDCTMPGEGQQQTQHSQFAASTQPVCWLMLCLFACALQWCSAVSCSHCARAPLLLACGPSL